MEWFGALFFLLLHCWTHRGFPKSALGCERQSVSWGKEELWFSREHSSHFLAFRIPQIFSSDPTRSALNPNCHRQKSGNGWSQSLVQLFSPPCFCAPHSHFFLLPSKPGQVRAPLVCGVILDKNCVPHLQGGHSWRVTSAPSLLSTNPQLQGTHRTWECFGLETVP